MSLPFSRYLNVIHHWIFERIHKREERERIERLLASHRWLSRRRVTDQDEEYTPSWWRGEEQAAASAAAFARSMGVDVQSVITSASE